MTKAEIQLLALGGLGETGSLNCMLYETKESAIVVDCGIGFPDDFFPGVNVMIPDFQCLENIRSKLKALVLTHGHEDHVGAISYFTKQFGLPIYATAFTQGVVCQKLNEQGLQATPIKDLVPGRTVTIGDFSIEPVFVNHSILDTVGLLIEHQGLKAFHLTDFKIDQRAPDGKRTDLEHFKKIGDDGLDLLLSDSTNALSQGWTESELSVEESLLNEFRKTNGRILACLFSSNVIRLQALINCARATNRKVALTGRSTKEYFRIANEIRKIDLRGVEFLDVEETKGLPDENVLLVVTGSQAEPRSVLQRISEDQFKPFRIQKGDTILMSSKMIPGNEHGILRMFNRLAILGAELVLADKQTPIHASGHAKIEELKTVFQTLRPKNFIPIHGEYLHLQKHQELAISEGLSKKQTLLALNGDKVSLTADGLKVVDEWHTDRVLLTDDRQIMTWEAMKKRRKMAWNGLVAASVLYSSLEPERIELALESYGVIDREEEELACFDLKEAIAKEWQRELYAEKSQISEMIRVQVRRLFRDRYSIKPEVIVLQHDLNC